MATDLGSFASGEDFLTRILQFLSDASNETLGACFVGLAIVTILVLGRVGAVLIGVVAGVVLHATWKRGYANNGDGDWQAKRARRPDSGIDVARRVLDWQAHRKDASKELERYAKDPKGGSPSIEKLDFSALPPKTRSALSNLTDAVIRDYVRWWYSPILPDERNFISACKATLTSFLLSISSHISRKRPADVFLDFLANTSSITIVFLNELANALSTSVSASTSSAEDIEEYITSNPESNLANLMDEKHQNRKLYVMADDILHNFLDPEVYSCKPARVFLREIFAGVVLKMMLDTCSKPEWLNGWIIYLLEGNEIKSNDSAPSRLNSESTGEINGTAIAAVDERAEKESGLDHLSAMLPGKKSHEHGMSKAEAAMKQAILEAERMNRLIAEEDARREAMGMQTRRRSTADSPKDDVEPDTLREQQTTHPARKETTCVNADSPSYFTSFDQLVPSRTPTALQSNPPNLGADTPPSTEGISLLYKANVSFVDVSGPSSKSGNQAKSNMEYLIQVEPSAAAQSGWIIARKYADFEKLHEVLRRISVISGVSGFQNSHASLPSWKGQKKSTIQSELEKYIQDALSYRELADSEAMKRFLEKTQGFGRSFPNPTGKAGFPNAIGTVGKGMLDVLTNTPKGVGGVLGGVTSRSQKKDNKILGKKDSTKDLNVGVGHAASNVSSSAGFRQSGDGQDEPRIAPPAPAPITRISPAERRSGDNDDATSETNSLSPARLSASSKVSLNQVSNTEYSQSSPGMDTPQQSPQSEKEEIHLPPLPTEIPDDYDSVTSHSAIQPLDKLRGVSDDPRSSQPSTEAQSAADEAASTLANPGTSSDDPTAREEASPLTDQETQVAIDLSFAMITELYNLSSAWNIRRTLLTAAKNFLNVETIRTLIQNSIIDAHSSDEAIAGYIHQIEEKALPTEEQLRAWPSPPDEQEKERLRVRARRLLVEKGLPPALTSVMGSAASKEALGKVFDSLQIERVSRGLIFGLLLQALRVVTQ